MQAGVIQHLDAACVHERCARAASKRALGTTINDVVLAARRAALQSWLLAHGGPVQQGSDLNLTVLSTIDRLCLGAMACKERMPDVESVAAGFVDAVAELRRLADDGRS